MPPEIDVRLEQESYRPGELMTGAFAVTADDGDELETLEVSVLWHTAGYGDEDLGVIHFEEWPAKGDRPFDQTQPHAFTARLPRTPLSYDGEIVQVRWCVRVRARWVGGGETLREEPFCLGATAGPDGTEA